MKVAIGHDLVAVHADGKPQSFSAVWKARADTTGVAAEVVEPLLPGALDKIRAYDAFIWRYNFRLPWTAAAQQVMRAVEDDLGIPVWPPRVLRETFENKIAQAYLLDALRIPHPRSWVFWQAADARAALADLPLPLVTKLSRGVRSQGVALVRTREEAVQVIDRMFSFGVGSMSFMRERRERWLGKYTPMLEALRRGRFKGNHERGYVLFQEFIAGNAFDTRLVVQGDRLLALRRHNREGDFRASGSGRLDYDPDAIAPAAIALAFELADAIGVRSLVCDVIHDEGRPLINEFSYSMAMYAIRGCAGHWRRTDGSVLRVDSVLNWPHQIFDDFVADVRSGAGQVTGRHRATG
jgi:glutathione synthase/RimK-type ligase-like ATP-grasp enzyme